MKTYPAYLIICALAGASLMVPTFPVGLKVILWVGVASGYRLFRR